MPLPLPRICAQSKEPRWRRASCCLWVPEVTTQGTEVLGHREILAIESGIKHNRTYMEGTKFQVETGHDPLTRLSNLKDSHGRLARWALTLQPYHFTVVHRSGTANANADGLSRVHGSRVGGGSVKENPDCEDTKC